jgi:hypothetical protein
MGAPLLASVSAIAVAGYLGAVMYHGNLMSLVNALRSDWRFLEWVAAVGILYLLARESYIHGPVVGLIGIGIVAFLLHHAKGVTAAGNDVSKGNLFKALTDLAQ